MPTPLFPAATQSCPDGMGCCGSVGGGVHPPPVFRTAGGVYPLARRRTPGGYVSPLAPSTAPAAVLRGEPVGAFAECLEDEIHRLCEAQVPFPPAAFAPGGGEGGLRRRTQSTGGF